jgi:hypothetical protein
MVYDRYLVILTGKPPWYECALFPTFFLMNVAAFCVFALAGLKFAGGREDG